jgi:hypothetical protein
MPETLTANALTLGIKLPVLRIYHATPGYDAFAGRTAEQIAGPGQGKT